MAHSTNWARRAGFVAASLALTAPQTVSAQLFLVEPQFAKGPIDGSDPLVGLPIPGANAAEQRAHLIWNLRAGLNVAALQCQFSPYLRTVSNYNGLLAHHSAELADAYTKLNGYFKRIHGPKAGQKQFDDYSTITYNNFSTLQAQYGFCQTAGSIGKEALLSPKGQLHQVAANRMRELRSSLVPAYDRVGTHNPAVVPMLPLPPLRENCWDKRDRLLKACGGTA
ncbi:MAG TPA: hypothetical protein VGR19_06170 [Allosphingosinicella sp.]|nr:hypothetical protein [Allosphingosinicella sp.]